MPMRWLCVACMVGLCGRAVIGGDALEQAAAPAPAVSTSTVVSEKESETIRALIANLGADEFEIRQHAADELIAIGKKAVPILSEVKRQTKDPEVLARIVGIFKKIAEKIDMEGLITLPSGLQYKVLKEGSGESPKASDVVEVHYSGKLVDGTEFDSSYKRGQTIKFPLNGVIAGWTEGLQKMKPGSKHTLVIPAKLAYGDNPPPGSGIQPGATLIFDVELISVVKK
jgi:FKBP-type peptidyl-prolyl cis-trans isomerase